MYRATSRNPDAGSILANIRTVSMAINMAGRPAGGSQLAVRRTSSKSWCDVRVK